MHHDYGLQELLPAFHAQTMERSDRLLAAVDAFLRALEAGVIRAASRRDDGTWHVHTEVKQAILVCFRLGRIEPSAAGPLSFSDKDTVGPQHDAWADRGVRVVPGGSSIRRGAHIGARVTCMPPMYINVGAYVDDETMVDSHALVGSCAQIGRRVHLSAGAQIGGVLEPVGMRPVVIEDGVLVGGNTGVYEGTLVRQGAVLGAGVILTASTPVYDLVNERVIRAAAGEPLEIPANAVVVPGSRPVTSHPFAAHHGLHVHAPMIVKYRDGSTDLRTVLEEALR